MGADSRLQPEQGLASLSKRNTSSHGALLLTASQPVCPVYISNWLPFSFDSLHLLPLTHIPRSSSTYLTFPGLSNYKEPSPHRKGKDLTRQFLVSALSPIPSIWEGITGNE